MAIFWKDETSGKMQEIVKKYFDNQDLNKEEIDIMRNYLMEWVQDSGFIIEQQERNRLRNLTKKIKNIKDIKKLSVELSDYQIDPF